MNSSSVRVLCPMVRTIMDSDVLAKLSAFPDISIAIKYKNSKLRFNLLLTHYITVYQNFVYILLISDCTIILQPETHLFCKKQPLTLSAGR